MIREEFEDFAISVDKNQYSIYKNPNRREMKELVKENGFDEEDKKWLSRWFNLWNTKIRNIIK